MADVNNRELNDSRRQPGFRAPRAKTGHQATTARCDVLEGLDA